MVFDTRLEMRGINTTAPQDDIVKTMCFEGLFHLRRRHHDRLGGTVEPAHETIGQGLRQQLARTQIFGKAGVISGAEIELATQAVAACRQAHWPFGSDMNAVRRESVERSSYLGIGPIGQPNFGISRTSKSAKIARCQHQYLVPLALQALLCGPQSVNYAIDLRLACVAYDGNAHKSSTPANFDTFLACMISPQVTRRNSPEVSSTKADRLSTQSPSLQ